MIIYDPSYNNIRGISFDLPDGYTNMTVNEYKATISFPLEAYAYLFEKENNSLMKEISIEDSNLDFSETDLSDSDKQFVYVNYGNFSGKQDITVYDPD